MLEGPAGLRFLAKTPEKSVEDEPVTLVHHLRPQAHPLLGRQVRDAWRRLVSGRYQLKRSHINIIPRALTVLHFLLHLADRLVLMKTTCAIVVAAVLGASLLLQAAEPPASGPNVLVRPNVLILFADDMRADAIAALGNPVIKTPNLDRLVRRGVAFDRAYMQGSFTPATCVPSRAMLMTGRTLFHIDAKRSKEATWPEAFGEAGYTTFVSGKWHNSDAMPTRSFQIALSMYVGGPFFAYVPFNAPHDPHVTPPDFPV